MSHLFVSSTDGALYDTRRADWPTHPLRAVYSRTFSHIESTQQLRATLRAGAYAWPGGYPMYFISDDGAPLSFEAVRNNYRQCAASIRGGLRDGWRIVACGINYEDPDLMCEHTGAPIAAAYS